MDSQELKKKLKEMRQELLNLKISHKRGVGSVSYFEKIGSINVKELPEYGGAIVKIIAKYPHEEVFLPPFASVEIPFTTAVVMQDEPDSKKSEISYSVHWYDNSFPRNLPVRIISSKPIYSMELECNGERVMF